MKTSNLTEDVLRCLNTQEWKKPIQLCDEVKKIWEAENRHQFFAKLVGVFSPKIADLFGGPSIAGVYSALTQLEDEGLARWRWRTLSPSELELRGGRPGQEWKRDESGRRRRVDTASSQEDSQGVWVHA